MGWIMACVNVDNVKTTKSTIWNIFILLRIIYTLNCHEIEVRERDEG